MTGPEDDLDPVVNAPVDPPPIHQEDESDDPVDEPDEAPDVDDEECES
jgi:hypothetical protein